MRSRLAPGVVVDGAIPFSFCTPVGVPDLQAPIASAERLLLLKSLAIMLVVVVPVMVVTFTVSRCYLLRAIWRRQTTVGFALRDQFVLRAVAN